MDSTKTSPQEYLELQTRLFDSAASVEKGEKIVRSFLGETLSNKELAELCRAKYSADSPHALVRIAHYFTRPASDGASLARCLQDVLSEFKNLEESGNSKSYFPLYFSLRATIEMIEHEESAQAVVAAYSSDLLKLATYIRSSKMDPIGKRVERQIEILQRIHAEPQKRTRSDRLVQKIKNNKYFAPLIVVGIVFGAFLGFYSNIQPFIQPLVDKVFVERAASNLASVARGQSTEGEHQLAFENYMKAAELGSSRRLDYKLGAAESLLGTSDYDGAYQLSVATMQELSGSQTLLQAGLLEVQAEYHINQERRDEAARLVKRALQNIEDCSLMDCKKRRASLLSNLGTLMGFLEEDMATATSYLEQAIEIHVEIGDRENLIEDRGNLASAFLRSEDTVDDAIDLLNANLKELETLESHTGVVRTLYRLARATQKRDFTTANGYYERALSYIRVNNVTDRRLRARIRGDFARHYMRNEYASVRAIIMASKALETNVDIGDRSGMAVQLLTIFQLFEQTTEYGCAFVSGITARHNIKVFGEGMRNEALAMLARLDEYSNSIEIKSVSDFEHRLQECTDLDSSQVVALDHQSSYLSYYRGR